MNDVLKENFENINNILNKDLINENDKKIIFKNLFFIVKFIEEKFNTQTDECDYKEEFIKLKGELITMLFLLIYFGCGFNLNTKPIENNILDNGKNMELDFYFDEYDLAIEIDGKHHNNKE